MSFTVPQAIRAQAQEGLDLHARRAVPDVGGLHVARTLAGGEADEETVRRMRRFFTVNERAFTSGQQLMHSAQDNALMRSWKLHGGDAGRTWAEGVHHASLAEGGEPDRWVELLRTKPTAIYEKLNFGAWRWEYGMDVRQAARFVEEYARAHHVDFRFDKAFGESADTVKRALVRRVEGANPFKQLSAAIGKPAYRVAAQLDLRECAQSQGRRALFNWPNFVALAVLATHDSGARTYLLEGAEYPWGSRPPRPVMEYLEPLGDFVTFFHPAGACYLGDAPNGLNGRMEQLMHQIFEGEAASEELARYVLGEARRWTAAKRAVRGLGHTLLAAWSWRDWEVIFEALPLDSPVRPAFAAFADKTKGSWLAESGL